MGQCRLRCTFRPGGLLATSSSSRRMERPACYECPSPGGRSAATDGVPLYRPGSTRRQSGIRLCRSTLPCGTPARIRAIFARRSRRSLSRRSVPSLCVRVATLGIDLATPGIERQPPVIYARRFGATPLVGAISSLSAFRTLAVDLASRHTVIAGG